MNIAIYTRLVPVQSGTNSELVRAAVEDRGDTMLGVYCDDPGIPGKGRFKNWHRMIASLDGADVVLVPSIDHLPPKPLNEFYRTLAVFQAHGVSLRLHDEGIDSSTSAGMLRLIAVYRRAQTGLKIKRGQERARKLGRRAGRPPVPDQVRQRIMADLKGGFGVRVTGRKHGVSAASVVNIKAMMAGPQTQAA